MNKTILRLSLALIFLLSTACAGPIVVGETARTVGRGNYEALVSYGQSGYAGKWTYGIWDSLDLGIQVESLSLGVRAKYSFIDNRQSGWSFAGALGTGTTYGGNYWNLDMMTSYLSGIWEPYGTLRLVQVKIDAQTLKDKQSGEQIFTFNAFSYDYGELALGLRSWVTPAFFLSAELAVLAGISSPSGIDSAHATVGSAALGWKF